VGPDVAAYNEARLALHTHFVRSGCVMLYYPARDSPMRTTQATTSNIPTSHEVGMCKNARRWRTSDLL